MKSALPIGLMLLLAGLVGSGRAELTPEQVTRLPAPANRPVSFRQDIKPILEASCVKCHGRGRNKGGFRVDSRETVLKGGESGPAALSGKSAESYLIELVSGIDPDNVMPKKGSKLTPEQVGLLRAWIDQGLPWDSDVSFGRMQPQNLTPRTPEVPDAKHGGLSRPIDRIIGRYFEANHIARPPSVADRVFARRVYLDVIGLLPAPKELERFAADKGADKRARLVKRLLADDQRYAEHWLTFWNDALRNDYKGTGYIDGGRKQISAWLFEALVRNLPYDQFVAQLINPTAESEGFTKGIIWRGVVNASQTPQMQAAQNISQVFMGVNLKCASCHDSFINDWTLADAYGLANIYSDEPLEVFQCDKPIGRKAATKFIYPELGDIDAAAPKADRLKQLSEIITGKKDGRLSRTVVNRLWAKFFGRGLVEPVDDMEQPAWNNDLLDWLAEDLVAHGYDLKHTIEQILTSQSYQLPSVGLSEQQEKVFVFRGPSVRRLSAEQFVDGVAALTGNWHAKPAGEFDFTCVDPDARNTGSGLKGKWIWSEAAAAQSAPTGAVYFRRIITLAHVPTQAMAVVACDNSFTLYVNGKNAGSGKEYKNPALIDLRPHLRKGTNVLAVAAINSPPSGDKTATNSTDNAAGLYFHARLRQGRKILDFGSDKSWLWANDKDEGWKKPDFGVTDWKPAIELGDAAMLPWKLEKKLAQTVAGTVMQGKARAALVTADPLMIGLGRPNREQVTTSRPSAATTLQMLELTNGKTLSELLQKGAAKLVENGLSGRQLVERLYLQALGRKPTGDEWRLAEELIGSSVQKEEVEDLLWAMLMLPEFQLIY